MMVLNWRILGASVLALGLVAGCGDSDTGGKKTGDTATPAKATAEDAAGAQAGTAAGSASAASGAVDLIPRKAIFGNPERTQGRISPDGKWLSWLAPKDGVMNVWVAPADDPSKARVITNDTYRGIRNHTWARNSAYVLYAQDKGGNENFHLYAADVNSGEVRDLTPVSDKVRAQIQGLSPRRPDVVLVGLNDRNPQLFDLYEINVTTGERTKVMENPGFAGWVIDHDLKPRFAFQQVPGGGAKLLKPDAEGKWTPWMDISQEDVLTTNVVGFDASGEHLFMVDSKGRDKAALVKLNVETKESEVLASHDKADINSVLLHPTEFEPIAWSADYLRVKWQGIGDYADDIEALTAAIEGDLSILGSSNDLSKVVVHAESAQAPGTYYLYDREAESAEKMFNTRPELADAPLVPMRPLEIESRDGLTLVSYLTLPPGSDADGDGTPETPVPMVLAVHGGPWSRDSYGYNAWHQWLANRGYAVLSVNYRGSTGFGKAFVNASMKEFAGKMHDDLIDGVRYAVDNGIAQDDKVAIAGGSYGGYATLIGMTFTPETFACGVDIVGPSSLVTLVESFPEYWKPVLEVTWYPFVGNPAVPEQRKDMLARSAISRVDAISRPLLIGQGENDPRVTKKESDQLVQAMVEKDLPVTYVNFPDEGHGFARPANRQAFYAVMEGFLSTCLGGRAQPIGDAFKGSSVQILEGAEHVDGLNAAIEAHDAAGPKAAEEESAGGDGQ